MSPHSTLVTERHVQLTIAHAQAPSPPRAAQQGDHTLQSRISWGDSPSVKSTRRSKGTPHRTVVRDTATVVGARTQQFVACSSPVSHRSDFKVSKVTATRICPPRSETTNVDMDGASTDAHLDVYLDVGASTALSGPSQMHGNPLTNSEGTISLPSKSESDVPQSPALVASNGTSSSRRRYRPKLTIDPHALLTPNYPSDDGERTPTPHTHSGGDEIVEVQRELVLQYTPAPFSAPAPDVSPASTKSHGSTASRRSTGTYPNRNSRRRAHWTDALLAAEKTYAFRPRPGSSGSDGRLRANSVSSKVSRGRRPSHSSSGRPHWTDALLPVVPPRLPKPPAPDPPSSPGSSEQVHVLPKTAIVSPFSTTFPIEDRGSISGASTSPLDGPCDQDEDNGTTIPVVKSARDLLMNRPAVRMPSPVDEFFGPLSLAHDQHEDTPPKTRSPPFRIAAMLKEKLRAPQIPKPILRLGHGVWAGMSPKPPPTSVPCARADERVAVANEHPPDPELLPEGVGHGTTSDWGSVTSLGMTSTTSSYDPGCWSCCGT